MASSYLSTSRKQRTISVLLAIWTALVTVIFVWQLVHYRGLVAFEAEWQFGLFGQAYPLISFLAPVVLLASPGLIVFWRARIRRSEERLSGATIRSAIAFQRVMLGVSACFEIGALIFLIASLTIITDPDLRQRIDLAKPVITVPMEGQTAITGSLLYTQTTALDQNLIVARTNQRFAPMVPPGATANDLQFFIELPDSANPETLRDVSTVSGILQRNVLPGELVRLYRYAGFRVEQPYYVIFLSKESIALPQQRMAIVLMIIGLVFGILGLVQRRRIKRLEADLSE